MSESTLVPDQLLTTKFFVPRAPHALIARPRLAALLNEGLPRKLTLVSAPAGFGKTTLVVDWLSRLQHAACSVQRAEGNTALSANSDRPSYRVAWLSLDAADNDPARFWIYVFSALDNCYPGVAAPFVSSLQMQQAPLEHVLIALINALLDIPEAVVLVLDNYDVVTEPAIHTALTFLLEHLPPSVHLMLLTRAEPELPLSRLRAQGQVLELCAHQLCCTGEEAEAFLKEVMGIALPPDELQEVIAPAEGWLAGLQLLGLCLQTKADRRNPVAQLSGSHPYILNYLTEEVLQRQPQAVQAFLLRTAFLDRMCASLCDAVLGNMNGAVSAAPQEPAYLSLVNAQSMLEYLERSNLFVVPLDAQRRWYRYHPLFAEALRYRFEQRQPEQVAALHGRASRWFAEHGRADDAIEHALVARDWPWAANLIEHYNGSAVVAKLENDVVGLRRWMERLPDEFVRSRPLLCLLYARALLGTVPTATIYPWLAAAETSLRAALELSPGEEERGAAGRQTQEYLLGEVIILRALLVGLQGDGRTALSLCQQALAYLAREDSTACASVSYVQAVAHAVLGQAALASERAQEAAARARTAGHAAGAISSIAIMAICCIADQLQLHGQLHQSWRLLQQAAQLGELPMGGRSPLICWVYTMQAEVLREWNRLDEAHALVSQAIQRSERFGARDLQAIAQAALAGIERARGRQEAAHDALQQAEQIVAQPPFSQLLAARVPKLAPLWLESGKAARARYRVEQLTQGEGQLSPWADEHAQMAFARIALAEGRGREALERLTPLLEQARATDRWGAAIEALVLQALAYQMQHNEREGLRALAEALRLAEPEGYTRVFADEGAPLATLLARLREQEQRRGPTPYLDTVLSAFEQGLKVSAQEVVPKLLTAKLPGKTSLIEPLSTRELEVLQLVARGASNQEIAAELLLAVNTVKRHVSNIIGKLRTANRTQAVAQARDLGLLVDERSVARSLLAVA